MKKFIRNLAYKYTKQKMIIQLIIVFFGAVFTPIVAMGITYTNTGIKRMENYYSELLKSNNGRVRSVLFEITNQLQNISNEICFNDEMNELLSQDFDNEEQFVNVMGAFRDINNYEENYAGISEIRIYCSDEFATKTKCFRPVDQNIRKQSWFQIASAQYSPFWYVIEEMDDYNNSYRYLSLFRKITIYGKNTDVILMIKVDTNYIKNRIETEANDIILADEYGNIFYTTNRIDVESDLIKNTIDAEDKYYTYNGDLPFNGISSMASISTLHMAKTESRLIVTTIDTNANPTIQQVKILTILIVGIAIAIPAIIMLLFIREFNKQVVMLRDEMYKASQGDYDLAGDFNGCKELDAAYTDLCIMVDKIKEMDARMYDGRIAEQKLLNEQQKMEFQMLASQINPHFLYNTLEMIRMKAISADDAETAKAIKLLGKSMRYVLDNTGIEYTTIAKELSHIETYLQIQRLRFGDRVNYVINCPEDIRLDKILILPLLLQPIVENAILHGLEEVESGGMITIDICRADEEDLQIAITDNGCGMDADTLYEMRYNLEHGTIDKRYGIGLFNIHQRIKLCYGMEYGLSIDSTIGKGTTVTAKLKILM